MTRLSSALSVLFLAAALPVAAHPHVFINDKITVIFGEGTLQGILLQWTFDDMFSAMILGDYDPQRTGKFDAARTKAVKEGAFDNLVSYHYFVALWIGKTPVNKFSIQQFTPSENEKKQLVYTFFIPVKVPVTPTEQAVLLTVYDDSYYVAFDLLHLSDVTVQAGTEVSTQLAIQKTKVKPQWPGQYMPDQLVITFKENS